MVGWVWVWNCELGEREDFSLLVNVHIEDEVIFIIHLCPNDDSEVRWVQKVVQDGMGPIWELEICYTGRTRLSPIELVEEMPFLYALILLNKILIYIFEP